MEKHPQEKQGLFEDDGLDVAIANVDDTGMVKSQQQIIEGEEIEYLPEEPQDEEAP